MAPPRLLPRSVSHYPNTPVTEAGRKHEWIFYDSLYSTYGCLTGLVRVANRTIATVYAVGFGCYGSRGPDICGLGNRPSAPGCAIVYCRGYEKRPICKRG